MYIKTIYITLIIQKIRRKNPIKYGKRTSTDMSQQKIYEWPINTWIGAQNHCSSGKCKLKL